MHRVSLLVIAATSLVSVGLAQSVKVPNTEPATHTGGPNTLVRNAANPRTYQQIISASQLSGIPVGARINGYSIRFAVTASNTVNVPWPPVTATWADYEIHVGPSISPASAFLYRPLGSRFSAPSSETLMYTSMNSLGLRLARTASRSFL